MATTAPGLARRRPPLLAGVLLVCAGLIDIVASYANTHSDPFAVATRSGLYRVDITGWAWLHVGIGAAVAIAGLVVVADRPWTAPVGITCAALGIAIDVMLLPYDPVRAALVAGLNVAAIRLLIRHRRSRPP